MEVEDDRHEPCSAMELTPGTGNKLSDPCCTISEALRGISLDARRAGIVDLGGHDGRVK